MRTIHDSVKHFLELTSLPSPSGRERPVADYCINLLEKMGGIVREDDAGKRTGGDAGNVIAYFSGTDERVPVLMLNAHLDTVEPGGEIHPEVKGDRIVSRGETILGADNKAGLVMILEGLAAIREKNVSHGGIEVVLTVGEEVGLIGATHLDYKQIKSKHGFSFDSSGLGRIVKGAPFYNAIDILVSGRAAHAGVNPTAGLNSVQLTAEAVSQFKFGMLDSETTANIGRIAGGAGRNVIPDRCESIYEIRSHSVQRLEELTSNFRDIFELIRSRYRMTLDGREIEARVDFRVHREFDGFCLDEKCPVIQCAAEALDSIGRRVDCYRNMGGSDANVFNAKGIETAIVGTGQMNVHSKDEYIRINDLIDGSRLVPEIVHRWSICWTQKIT